MSFENGLLSNWSWSPQDPLGEEHRIASQYLEDILGARRQSRFLSQMERLPYLPSQEDRYAHLIGVICKENLSELVELLYPVMPEAFHTPYFRYERTDARSEYMGYLSPSEEQDGLRLGQPPPAEPLGQRAIRANALTLCALLGSTASLWALLEQGADPNGLSGAGTWNKAALSDHHLAAAMPVTPLDCARVAKQEDCCLLLELYGGQTVQELCGLEGWELPPLYCQAVLEYEKEGI